MRNLRCYDFYIVDFQASYAFVIEIADCTFPNKMINQCTYRSHLGKIRQLRSTKPSKLTHSGDESTEVKLDSLIIAFHRIWVGSPNMSSHATLSYSAWSTSVSIGDRWSSGSWANKPRDIKRSRPLVGRKSLRLLIWKKAPDTSAAE